MSLKVDRLELEIVINNDQSRKQLRELNEEALRIQSSMKGMVKGSEEYVQASQKLNTVKNQMDGVYEKIGITGLSLKELVGRQREFNMMLNNMNPSMPQYKTMKETLDQINARIKELKGNAQSTQVALGEGGFAGAFTKLTEWAVKFGAAALAAFSFVALKNYVKEGIESAIKLRDTEKIMLDLLDGEKSRQKELIALAKEKAGTTMFGRQEIEEAEKFLLIQGRSQEQIKRTMQAAMDLSAVTGNELKNSIEDLDGTMEGRMGKSLGKLEKDFKNLSKEQLYNGDAIEIVRKKYAGIAEGEMNTIEGKVNLLEKSWGALQRTIGDFAIGSGGIFDAAIEGATSFLGTIKKILEVPMSQKMQEESDKVNMLASSLTDLNLPAADRNKLYDELNKIAPEVLKGIDKEAISYTTLTKNLQEYNDMMVNKIILQKEDEKLDGVNATYAKARKARIDQENYIRQKAYDNWARWTVESKNQNAANQADTKKQIEDQRTILNNSNLTFSQKMNQLGKTSGAYWAANNMYQMLAETEKKALVAQTMAINNKKKLISDLGIDVNALDKAEEEKRRKSEEESKKENHHLIEKNDLLKQTTAELENLIAVGKVQGASEEDKKNADAAEKEIKRREKLGDTEAQYHEKYKSFMEEIHGMELENYADHLSQTESEIKSINEKYDIEIKRIEEFKEKNKDKIKPKEVKELDDQKGQLEITRNAQTKQVLEQVEVQFAEKVKQIHEALRVARLSITDREVYEINQKYDALQKEILDAIEYRYQQEVKEAGGNKDKLAAAEKNKADAISKIDSDLNKLKQARSQETDKALASGAQRFEDELKNLKLKSDQSLAKGKEKIQLEINAKYKKLLDDNVNDEKRTAEIKAQMADEQRQKEQEANKEHFQKLAQDAEAFANTVMSSVQGLESAWSAYENAILAKDQASNDKKKAELKKRLDSGKITQKQYDAEISKMDLEMDAKKKKIQHDQAKRAKDISLMQAIISTAAGIVQALANPGGIAGIVLAALVGILGAVQIGVIASTPVPEAAEGRYNVIGQQSGKKYNDVPYVHSPKTGKYTQPTIFGETGDEIIIDPFRTRDLTMNHPLIIDAIMNPGGYSVLPQRAAGKYPDMGNTLSGTSMGGAPMTVVVASDPEHTTALNTFNNLVMSGKLQAVISYDHLMDENAKVSAIQSDVLH